MPEQVFISYCQEDAGAANRICSLLEDRGIACWIAPRNIPPGREWPVAIPEAIRASSSLLLLLSSHSAKSRQIGREVDIADRNRIRIISFRLEDVPPPQSLEYFLNNLQWVDGFGVHFESGIRNLENALRNVQTVTAAVIPPQRRKGSEKRELAISLLIALALALAMQALEYYGWFAGPDGRIFDNILAGRPQPNVAAQNPVSVLAIDDAAYESKACFNASSPLNPALVMSLLRAALDGGPSVVGVDIFTEGDQYRNIALRANDPTVIWMAGTEAESRIEVASLPQWLLGMRDHIIVKPGKVLGFDPGEFDERREIHWAIPAFPPDDDFTIRRFPRRVEVSADPQSSSHRQSYSSWAAQVAQEYCRFGNYCTSEGADELYVSYSGPAPEELNMLDYFECQGGSSVALRPGKAAAFKGRCEGKALLIGGTFKPSGTNGDYHQTPKGMLAGVFINAYAVRAEIEGSGLHDMRQPWACALDFAIGALLVLIFYRPLFDQLVKRRRLRWAKAYETRCKIGASMALLAVCYFAIRWWPGAAYLKGFSGVCLGVLLHQIIALLLDNPRRAEQTFKNA